MPTSLPRELLRAGHTPHQPPFHSQTSCVCRVRWFARAPAGEEEQERAPGGSRFVVAAADDLAALAASGTVEAVEIREGEEKAASAVAQPGMGLAEARRWAELIGGMALGEAARCLLPASAAQPSTAAMVVVLELLGWIEERQLRWQEGTAGGPGCRCCSMYMERARGVNDQQVAIPGQPLRPGQDREAAEAEARATALPEPLGTVQVWLRAQRQVREAAGGGGAPPAAAGGGEVLESVKEGLRLEVDEPNAEAWAGFAEGAQHGGGGGSLLSAAAGGEAGRELLAGTVDAALRWMRCAAAAAAPPLPLPCPNPCLRGAAG